MDERYTTDSIEFYDVPKFRTSWDGLRYDGEYRDHRFNAAYYAAEAGDAQGYWLMWYYWPGMPVDYDGFAIHPATAPNGRPCTGYYATLADVRAAIGAILASIYNPNVVAFRPKAHQTQRPSKRTDGPLVA